MNVTFLNPAAILGGAERCLIDVIRAVRDADARFDPSCILLDEGPLEQELRKIDVPMKIIKLPTQLAQIGDSGADGGERLRALARLALAAPQAAPIIRRIRSAVRELRSELVHSNGFKAHLLSAAAVPAGVALLWHVHDFVGSRPFASKMLQCASLRKVSAAAVSVAVAEDVRATLGLEDVTAIHNAIDTESFRPQPIDARWLDTAAGSPPAATGVVRVGLVATYAKWKGQDVFIDAVAQLPAERRRLARFYIIGGQVYRTAGSQWSVQELRRRAQAQRVEIGFVPFEQHPERIMQSLDVVVHASTQPEPFGRTIIEAMACAKPTIASRGSGAAELFGPGTHGLAVSRGSAGELALAMSSLIVDGGLRQAMGRAARAHAETHFNLGRLGRQFGDLYRRVGARA